MGQNLQNLFGFELSTGLRWIIAFAIVLVLVALFAFILRRITGGRLRIKGQGSARARQPRLGVVDIHDLDRQRQLILIRRDNVEHLVMIGGASDVVVETNILRSGARVAAPAQVEYPASDRPSPPDFATAAEPPRTAPPEEPRRAAAVTPAASSPVPETSPPLPSRAAPPLPPKTEARPASQPSAAPAAIPAGAAAAIVSAAVAPSFARDHAPAPAASPIELDDMARQLEEALKRPFSAVRPSGASAVDHPAPSKPAPPERETEAKVEMAVPVPPGPAPMTGRPVAMPADVEAELELALGLKAAAKPAPVDAPLLPADVAPNFVLPAVEPAPKVEPVVYARPPFAEPESKTAPAIAAPVAERESRGAAPDAEDKKPEPEPIHAPVLSGGNEPAPAPVAESKPETALAQIDPFSVDAIEAEFARLLGRDPKPKS